MLGEFPAIRQVFHALCALEEGEDATELLDFAVRQAWPALMIGELVFARAGVHVRAGAAHAVPGIADRSALHWEYWRRHRITSDGSFWWGHNSQWKTEIRRDYITGHGHVYDFDAFSGFSRLSRLHLADGSARQVPLTADQVSFIKNRCQLSTNDEPSFDYTHYGIDERRPSRRGTALPRAQTGIGADRVYGMMSRHGSDVRVLRGALRRSCG